MTDVELVALIQNGESERIPELWKQMERFIRHKARRKIEYYKLMNLSISADVDDLVQSGYFALISAVKSYTIYDDPAEGCSFISYLDFFLRTEFANACGNKRPKQLKDACRIAVSLDASLHDEDSEDGDTLASTVEDPVDNIALADERVYQEQLKAALEAALNCLPANEAEAIRAVYFYGRSIRKNRYNLMTRAMRNLRRVCANIGLREFLEERPSNDRKIKWEPASADEKASLTREELQKFFSQAGDGS